ncbi:hypothetical protein O3P69_006797 [Scylla paramamosain]|uniref:Uncharacterized protein n=1 Tax=Scylla paramamosain TaxID=85552 RepID=A0AAW0U116_SCYPA
MHYTDEYSTPGDTPPALHHAAPSSASRPCREDRDQPHCWTKDKKPALAQTKRRRRCILNKYRLFVIVSGPLVPRRPGGRAARLINSSVVVVLVISFPGGDVRQGATAAAAAAITRPHHRTKLTPEKCCRPKERGRAASSAATPGHELLGRSLLTQARRSPRNGRGVCFSRRPTRQSPSPAVQRRPSGGEKPSRCRRRHHRPTRWSSCTLGCRPPPSPRHKQLQSHPLGHAPPNPLPRPRFEGEAREGRRVARTLQARGRRRERQRGREGKKKNDNARVLDIWVRSNGVEELLLPSDPPPPQASPSTPSSHALTLRSIPIGSVKASPSQFISLQPQVKEGGGGTCPRDAPVHKTCSLYSHILLLPVLCLSLCPSVITYLKDLLSPLPSRTLRLQGVRIVNQPRAASDRRAPEPPRHGTARPRPHARTDRLFPDTSVTPPVSALRRRGHTRGTGDPPNLTLYMAHF